MVVALSLTLHALLASFNASVVEGRGATGVPAAGEIMYKQGSGGGGGAGRERAAGDWRL